MRAVVIVRWPGNSSPGHEHEARPEEFTSLGELGRNAPGVQHGRILIGMLASNHVRRDAVSVDDVKEVTHVGWIRPGR